ncbi:MAG: hypothetical protein C0392_13490 [Syntrophus sp. (in: bacteria)]|nr:hypothetical protein [Syntrophus sp. (in: bacteria)]
MKKNRMMFIATGRMIRFFLCVVIICLLLSAHSTAVAQGDGGASPAKPSFNPRIVYVADFLLEAVPPQKGIQGPLQVRKKIRGVIEGAEESPQEKAAKIIDLLARSIVSALNDRNIRSARFSGQAQPSSQSWLLEGEFMDFEEGDRLKKAVIGFGSGSGEMEIRVRLSEVMDGGIRPLFDSIMDGKKSRMPGAAITKNPYVAGAKFIMAKTAPEKEIKKMGTQIAGKLYEFMEKQGYVKP